MRSESAGRSVWSAHFTLQTLPHGQNKLFFPELG